MKLDFGIHIDKEFSDLSIPDNYICWLAERGSYTLPGNRFDITWKVPIIDSIEARKEMERRGWVHDGRKWRKKQ